LLEVFRTLFLDVLGRDPLSTEETFPDVSLRHKVVSHDFSIIEKEGQNGKCDSLAVNA
jgi:hypothetical protein